MLSFEEPCMWEIVGGTSGLRVWWCLHKWAKSWKIPIGMLAVLSLRCQDILLKFFDRKACDGKN